jgi:hypothetical protein
MRFGRIRCPPEKQKNPTRESITSHPPILSLRPSIPIFACVEQWKSTGAPQWIFAKRKEEKKKKKPTDGFHMCNSGATIWPKERIQLEITFLSHNYFTTILQR